MFEKVEIIFKTVSIVFETLFQNIFISLVIKVLCSRTSSEDHFQKITRKFQTLNSVIV